MGASGRSFSFKFFVYLLWIFFFFFLAMLCLSCGMWGLQSLLQHAGSLFVACRI